MRDLGLLKLFFAASASADEVAALADQQTAVHERMLAEYEAPPIDPGVDEALNEFIDRRKASMPDSEV